MSLGDAVPAQLETVLARGHHEPPAEPRVVEELAETVFQSGGLAGHGRQLAWRGVRRDEYRDAAGEPFPQRAGPRHLTAWHTPIHQNVPAGSDFGGRIGQLGWFGHSSNPAGVGRTPPAPFDGSRRRWSHQQELSTRDRGHSFQHSPWPLLVERVPYHDNSPGHSFAGWEPGRAAVWHMFYAACRPAAPQSLGGYFGWGHERICLQFGHVQRWTSAVFREDERNAARAGLLRELLQLVAEYEPGWVLDMHEAQPADIRRILAHRDPRRRRGEMACVASATVAPRHAGRPDGPRTADEAPVARSPLYHVEHRGAHPPDIAVFERPARGGSAERTSLHAVPGDPAQVCRHLVDVGDSANAAGPERLLVEWLPACRLYSKEQVPRLAANVCLPLSVECYDG